MKKKHRKNAFVCNLYKFPWYEHSHHGQCQTTNIWCLNAFESALAHHWVFQFVKNCLVNHNYNCRIGTRIWHILLSICQIFTLRLRLTQNLDLPYLRITHCVHKGACSVIHGNIFICTLTFFSVKDNVKFLLSSNL